METIEQIREASEFGRQVENQYLARRGIDRRVIHLKISGTDEIESPFSFFKEGQEDGGKVADPSSLTGVVVFGNICTQEGSILLNREVTVYFTKDSTFSKLECHYSSGEKVVLSDWKSTHGFPSRFKISHFIII